MHEHRSTPVHAHAGTASHESKWKKPASVWKMAQALTPRGRQANSNAQARAGGESAQNSVQLFAPLSEVPMMATTEPLFSHGRYNNRGSAHLNPFIEQ